MKDINILRDERSRLAKVVTRLALTLDNANLLPSKRHSAYTELAITKACIKGLDSEIEVRKDKIQAEIKRLVGLIQGIRS